jgi:hypothetical protein
VSAGEHLSPESVEAIAIRVAALLRQSSAPAATASLVDAAEVARHLGRSRAWVYGHSEELGAVRLGDGERPRLGFDPAKVAAYLSACETSRRTSAPAKPDAVRKRRRAAEITNGQGDDLLPIRGVAPPE